MTDVELVARALEHVLIPPLARSAFVLPNTVRDRIAATVVAALTEAGRLVPETTREFVSEPGESFDDARLRMERSAREWTECVTDISMRGDGIWVFTITAPAFVPDGCVCIDAGRWDRVRRLAAWADVLSAERENDTTIELRNAKRHIDLQPGDLDAEPRSSVCSACGGTGRVPIEDFFATHTTCDNCRGIGRVDAEPR